MALVACYAGVEPQRLGHGSALGTAAPWARPPVLNANFATTVYHGLPSGLHRPIAEPQGGYVAFLGRISPENVPTWPSRLRARLATSSREAAAAFAIAAISSRRAISPMLKGICSLFNTRLAELAVKDGDRVERGQVLPTVGDEKFVLQRRSLDAQIAGLLSL